MAHPTDVACAVVAGPWLGGLGHLTWFKMIQILVAAALWVVAFSKRLSYPDRAKPIMLVGATAMLLAFFAHGTDLLFPIGLALFCGAFLYSEARGRLGKPMDRAAVTNAFGAKEPPADVRGQRSNAEVTDIVLTDAGSRYAEVSRELRRMYGVSLSEAVSAARYAPITLRERVSMEEAEYVKSRLEAHGASVAFERSWPKGERGDEQPDDRV